jgi:hypothetical protein
MLVMTGRNVVLRVVKLSMEVEEQTPATAPRSGVGRKTVTRPRGPVGSHRVLAMLTRHDLIAAYRRQLGDLQSQEALESRGSNLFEEAQEPLAAGRQPIAPVEPAKPLPDVVAPAAQDLLAEPQEAPATLPEIGDELEDLESVEPRAGNARPAPATGPSPMPAPNPPLPPGKPRTPPDPRERSDRPGEETQRL